MVGIVIVSHSKALAVSLKNLAEQVGNNTICIEAAGGLNDSDETIGTDATLILKAIQKVYSPDGVIVFMDLGSAVLSTEMAFDFLDESQKELVFLSSAPLVEGVISAVVQAASGLSAHEILNEANLALIPKKSQLGHTTEKDHSTSSINKASKEQVISDVYTLRNTMGLHARSAAKLVRVCGDYKADVQIRNLSKSSEFVSARSMNCLISLQAGQLDQVEIVTSGEQSMQCHKKIAELLHQNFGESTAPLRKRQPVDEPKEVSSNRRKESYYGISVCAGFATGPVKHHELRLPEIAPRNIGDVEFELVLLNRSLQWAKEEIREIINQKKAEIGENEAGIFEAQILLIEDPELLAKVHNAIEQENVSAANAWRNALEYFIDMYEQSSAGRQLSTRVSDLIDVALRVLRHITGTNYNTLKITDPVVLVTDDLTPSDVASINPKLVLAICATKGSENSHSAILARSLGIPSVFGLGDGIKDLPDHAVVSVDGERGIVFTRTDHSFLEDMKAKRADWLEFREKAAELRMEPVTTEDGVKVQVMANVGSFDDVNQAISQGAEGIGLFRTEFVFMETHVAPTEDEQYHLYKNVARKLKGKPLTIRTIDIGGDKPVPYLNIEKEENPFLGWRGIRYSIDQLELFKVQLRAILRAGFEENILLLLPMVSTRQELDHAKRILSDCRDELKKAGIAFSERLKIGIMVEVPAAVICLESLISEVDFISLGTNDLTQYVMAADRTNPRVSGLNSHFQPAVLRMVRDAIKIAIQAGKEVSICGEMARDTRITPVLLGMGLRSFSMSSNGIPEFKWKARKMNNQNSAETTRSILTFNDSEHIKQYLTGVRV